MKQLRVYASVLIVCVASIGAILANGAYAFNSRYSEPVTICGTSSSYGIAPEGDCFSTCGGEIPWPFQVSNQVVELADGERYVLMGRVTLRDGTPRFVVDLTQHPWLANARRKADPSYPLSGKVAYWKQYEDRTIQLRAMAKWSSASDPSMSAEVYLTSLTDPAVVAGVPDSNYSSDARRRNEQRKR